MAKSSVRVCRGTDARNTVCRRGAGCTTKPAWIDLERNAAFCFEHTKGFDSRQASDVGNSMGGIDARRLL